MIVTGMVGLEEAGLRYTGVRMGNFKVDILTGRPHSLYGELCDGHYGQGGRALLAGLIMIQIGFSNRNIYLFSIYFLFNIIRPSPKVRD